MAGDKDSPTDEADDRETSGIGAEDGQASEASTEGKLARRASAESDSDSGEAPPEDSQVASQLGVQRYVHAAFFAAAILASYLLGKILLAAWNTLADWPDAVRRLPVLLEYTEDERASMTLVIGAVLGVLMVLRYYRRPSVRNWATDVAGELARVTWPSKDTVTNGTVVVLVAGAVATFYVAVLDRLWSYLTNLVYGT